MLRIPKPFVDRLAGDAPDSAIVDAILRLASSLGLTAVAEGAETKSRSTGFRSSAARSYRGTSSGGAESADDTLRFLRHATPTRQRTQLS